MHRHRYLIRTSKLMALALVTAALTLLASHPATAQDQVPAQTQTQAQTSPPPAAPPTATSAAAPGAAATSAASSPMPVPPGWLASLAEATKVAKEQNKLILIEFCAEWCNYCQMTDEVTLADAEVKKAIAGFVKVRLDTARDRQAASDYGVRGLPDFIVADSAGQEIAGNSGFLPPPQFLVFIRDITAYVAARQTLATEPGNADAAFAAASRCMFVNLSNDARLKLVTAAQGLVKPDDVARQARLLLLQGGLQAADLATRDEGLAKMREAAKLDPANQAGVREEADWRLIVAGYGETRDQAELGKAIDKYLADYPAEKLKDKDLRNEALRIKVRLALGRNNFPVAIAGLEQFVSENQNMPGVEALRDKIKELREVQRQQASPAPQLEPSGSPSTGPKLIPLPPAPATSSAAAAAPSAVPASPAAPAAK